MKTSVKQFTVYGNAAIVQVSATPQSTFPFIPGAPELRSGGLVITESTGEGIVGTLRAENLTSSYLLLTDADVLEGAKQNRIINKSVLLAPKSSTFIDVSCIERLRWHYTHKNFTGMESVADPDLRKIKASSLANRMGSPETQGKIWQHVSFTLSEKNICHDTESYSAYLAKMKKKSLRFPLCDPDEECNGIAIILDNEVISVDLFGNSLAYSHYFPHLRDSAFRMAVTGKKIRPADVHEASFKTLDFIDNFMDARRITSPDYKGAGTLSSAEDNILVGYDLEIEGQLVHNAVFRK